MAKRPRATSLVDQDDTERVQTARARKKRKKFCTCWRYCQGGRERCYSTWLNHGPFREAGADAAVATRPVQVDRRQGAGIAEQMSSDSEPQHQEESTLEEEDGVDSFTARRSPLLQDDFSMEANELGAAVHGDTPPRVPSPAQYTPIPNVESSANGHRVPGDDGNGLDDTEPDFGSDDYMEQIGVDLEPVPQDDDFDHELLTARSQLADIAVLQEFNKLLRNASLDDCDLTAAQLDRLRNPPEGPLILDPARDRILMLCLRTYMTCRSGSHAQYAQHIANLKLAYPDDADSFLSEAAVKDRLEKLTGVVAMMTDMCVDSCVAFTGPWASLEACPVCSKPRYRSRGKAEKQFSTILLPQQIQALRRHPESAKDAQYLWRKLEEIEQLIAEHGFIPEYDDIVCGSAIREAVLKGHICENDTVLMVTVDGAQLYRNKASDCWMYGWLLVNMHPSLRYKQRYILPGGFIGGPTKPKIFESFLHVGLRIVSAVNNAGGLRVWDAHLLRSYLTKLFIALALADGPGSTVWSSLVPHHGKIPCRIFCGMLGRHKPNSPIYYPAILKPDRYCVPGCDHSDIDPKLFRYPNVSSYLQNLRFVLESRSQTQFEQRRRDTGIAKPSPFMGMAPDTVLGPPSMFPLDVMHASLNWGDLLLSLWRGTIDCEATDSRSSWDFAVLRDRVWILHGEDVARCTRFLPSPFGRPPRNPAEKINSGYKAWEFVLYLWSLGPGILFGVLPLPYWQNFCKLVYMMRRCKRKGIPHEQIIRAYTMGLGFELEFEELYYRRRPDRLHFIRPTVHNITHMPSEILRIGPLPCSSQWTMERFIGLITADLKQHSTPYANIAARGLERAQLNALNLMVPELDTSPAALHKNRLPRGAKDLGGGFVLLRAKESRATAMTPAEDVAFERFLVSEGAIIPRNWKIQRWARLQLPNGQVVRSAWKELLKAPSSLRRARDAQISYVHDQTDYAEVRYYFRYNMSAIPSAPDIRTLAMVSLCSRPDEELLVKSYGTLWSCKHQGDIGLQVVDHSALKALVALCPHSQMLPDEFSDRVLVAEMPGLDVADLGGSLRAVVEQIERLGVDSEAEPPA